MLGKLLRGVWSRVRRNELERELDEELRFHLERETAENIRRGLAPAEARRAALVSLGGVEQTKEECRDATGLLLVDAFLQDVRYGVRSLRRNVGYTAVVIFTLALGIGANTAIFSVVYGVLLRPLPYGAGDRLVSLNQSKPMITEDPMPFSVKEIADYREQNHSFDGIAEYHSMSFILLGNAEPERVRTGVVSAEFFDLFDVKPILGRTFVADDDRPGADPVLLLSNGYWMRDFGGDPNIVGRTFEMNDRVHTVVGVLPPLPAFPDENDVYMCTSACPFRSDPMMIENRKMGMMKAFARLKPEASVATAQADLDGIAGRLRETYPDVYPIATGYAATLRPVHDLITGNARPTLLVLFATAALVLLIACANVANLVLARTSRREQELAIRATLGAGRGRLVRQLLTEGLVLSVLAGALGLVFAAFGLRLLLLYTAKFMPRVNEIHIDTSVLLFTLGVSILTGIAFSVMPVISARANLAPALASASGSRVAGGRERVRSLLIAMQVAVAFMLLISAGLMLRTLVKLQQVDAGFNAQHVVSMRIQLNWSRYTTPDETRTFFDRLMDRLDSNPQVIHAALASGIPLDARPFNQSLSIEGEPTPAPAGTPQADVTIVNQGYFTTMGIPVLRGRAFTAADRADAIPVAAISDGTARHRWGAADPVGSRLTLDDGKTWLTVVGVVADVKVFGLAAEPGDEIYVPFAQNPAGGRVLVRTSADSATVARFVREAVYEIDAQQPVTEVQTLEEVRSNSIAPSRLTAVLLGLFAALALTITAAGIGGVMALWVSQRTREIGVRMALGADRRKVLGMVLRQGMGMVVVGLVLGVAGALVATRLMSGLLFGVATTDAPTYVAVAVLLVAAAAVACFAPARRATAIDPAESLRAE